MDTIETLAQRLTELSPGDALNIYALRKIIEDRDISLLDIALKCQCSMRQVQYVLNGDSSSTTRGLWLDKIDVAITTLTIERGGIMECLKQRAETMNS